MKEFIKAKTKGYHHVSAIGTVVNINKVFLFQTQGGQTLSLELLRDYYKEFVPFPGTKMSFTISRETGRM